MPPSRPYPLWLGRLHPVGDVELGRIAPAGRWTRTSSSWSSKLGG